MLLETENILYWISGWFDNTSLSPSLSLFFSRVIILVAILLLAVIADYICRYFINSNTSGFSRATGRFIMDTETLYCLYHCGRSAFFQFIS